MVGGPRFGDHRAGFRFDGLSIALVDRGLARFRGQVYTVALGSGSSSTVAQRPEPYAAEGSHKPRVSPW